MLLAMLIGATAIAMSAYQIKLNRVEQEEYCRKGMMILSRRIETALLWDDRVEMRKLLVNTVEQDEFIRYAFIECNGKVVSHSFPSGVPSSLLGLPSQSNGIVLTDLRDEEGNRFHDLSFTMDVDNHVIHIGLNRDAIDKAAIPSILTIAMIGGIFFLLLIYPSQLVSNSLNAEITTMTDRLRDANELLEARVAERTADLNTANTHLTEGREQLAVTLNSIGDGVITTDVNGRVTLLNRVAEQLTGWKQAEAAARPLTEVFTVVNEETRKPVVNPVEQVLARDAVVGLSNHTILIPRNGPDRQVESNGAPIRDNAGKIVGVVLVFRDVTERARMEKLVEDSELHLQQAQKMELIGRLAGGVAHDFNNMLGVIIGRAEAALATTDPKAPISADLQGILDAADRSANLTRQLLAFARKQTVTPKVLNVNDTVAHLLSLLQRMIGENIRLHWRPGSAIWPVKMDPSQIDQILVNLCTNARDAITNVGTITVETGKATFDAAFCATHSGFLPGEFVQISVNDTGCGMDKQTLAFIFEPFFTTKEPGKGTGLGLASVYGTVKQNKGFINVTSEVGRGTSFVVHLPRHRDAAGDPATAADDAKAARPSKGPETILLVEDEPTVLEVTASILKSLGYTVWTAGTPSEAVRIAKDSGEKIDILVTDIVMPETNGLELSKTVLLLQPGMKLLYMSGYTADIIAHQGILEGGVQFIQKPFSRKDLATRIREILDT